MAFDIHGPVPLLSVFDMPTAVHFYRDILGFEIVNTSQPPDNFYWALLRLNGSEIMLNTAYDHDKRPASPDPARIAAHSDTALFFGCCDLDALYQHLRTHGCDPEEPFVQSYGMKQLYVKDPDGYTICFQWPVSQRTREQWQEWYGIDPEKD